MNEKFQNKYRITSHRKPGWDYSSDGHYFITLVVQHRYELLGRIQNGIMILNEWGKIVMDEWLRSFCIRTELFCDAFVIMPNHIHAIITIENVPVRQQQHDGASLQQPPPPRPCDKTIIWERKPKSISSFIAGYKSATNTAIDNAIDSGYHLYPHLGKFKRNNHFWQPNYHDHVIRDAESYTKISNYIANNPANWATHKFKLK